MDINLITIVDELEQITTKGKSLFGKCFINEEEFWLTTTKLKKAMPDALIKLSTTYEGKLDSLYRIDRLEHLVESSPKAPLTALAVIDPVRYRSLLTELKDALAEDLRKVAAFGAANLNEPDRVISDAHTEAERILAEARRQAGHLGSGPSMTLPDSFPDTPNRL